MAEETLWNKIRVDLIVPYKIHRKWKDPLISKSVTIIEPVTGWFEATQYRDKKAMTIENLVETTWLVRYPWPVEITSDRGGEFLGHEFKNILIENEYDIKNKPTSPGNPQANAIIERIHQVLGDLVRTYNLQETYIDDADPWIGILAAEAFAVRSTYHTTKGKIPGHIVFGRDMILPINHVAVNIYISANRRK